MISSPTILEKIVVAAMLTPMILLVIQDLYKNLKSGHFTSKATYFGRSNKIKLSILRREKPIAYWAYTGLWLAMGALLGVALYWYLRL